MVILLFSHFRVASQVFNKAIIGKSVKNAAISIGKINKI